MDQQFIESGEACESCESFFYKPQGRRKWCRSCAQDDHGANVDRWHSDYPELAAEFV